MDEIAFTPPFFFILPPQGGGYEKRVIYYLKEDMISNLKTMPKKRKTIN